MSFTVSITGKGSSLITNYSPTLELRGDYECGLLYFSTFNSIPNIDERNNKFYYGEDEAITIPEGSYELQDICDYLKSNMKDSVLKLTCNNNTLKTNIFCSKDVHFNKSNSLGKILGFGTETVKANISSESQYPVSILSTTIVRIECDVISGSFVNGRASHIIYEFVPNVPPGYRIIEIPKNLIYFPVNQSSINAISIRLLDAENKQVNLRGEEVQLYLHFRKKC
jgi:hypothetical protein